MSTYIFIGYILDFLLGDPAWLPNPVRLIGKFITVIEKQIQKWELDQAGLRRAGVFLVLFIIVITFLATWILMRIALSITPWLYAAVCTIIIFYCLAVGGPAAKAKKVQEALNESDESLARESLSQMFRRDTKDLNEEGIIRATVETLAENTVDGAVAPLFYIFLGGPALGMAFKAVSTVDMIINHSSSKNKDLGWAAAKLNEAVNWLPARLAGFIIPIAAGVWGKDTKEGMRIYGRDKNQHIFPYAGHPQAAIAGVLGVKLGGPYMGFGQLVDRPFLGDAKKSLELEDILDASRIMKTTAFFGFIVFYLVMMKFGFR